MMKKLRIWIEMVVMGFDDKFPSQNYYIWFLQIAHLEAL